MTTEATPEAGPEQFEQAGQAQQATPDGGQEGQQEQGPDFSPLIDRFDKLESQFGDRLSGLEQALTPGEEGQQPGGQPEPQQQYVIDPESGQLVPADQEYDEFLEDPRAAQQRMREEIRQEYRQELQPLLDRFHDQDLEKLEAKYPELKTRDGAAPVVAAAQRHAEQFGSPDLVEHPGFVELVHLAERAREKAEQEVPADAQQGAHLESGGATPPEPQVGQFERLHQQARGGNSFPWMG